VLRNKTKVGVFFSEHSVYSTRSSAVAESVRRFVSLNILLSHPRSLEITLLS